LGEDSGATALVDASAVSALVGACGAVRTAAGTVAMHGDWTATVSDGARDAAVPVVELVPLKHGERPGYEVVFAVDGETGDRRRCAMWEGEPWPDALERLACSVLPPPVAVP
jgi:hypothetical protein